MSQGRALGVLCLASYEKGQDAIREFKELGCEVYLLTLTSLRDAAWPLDVLDDVFYMPDLSAVDDVIHGVSYLARHRHIDRILPLDDYDVVMVARLREHLQLPGMNVSTATRFRDKLAMRVAAAAAGVSVPAFTPTVNDADISTYLETVPGPWMLKPRSEVSTIGINRIDSPDDLWPRLEALGDRRSYFLLERYLPGNVYHADAITWDGEVLFVEVHQYDRPPFDTFHGGGIPITRTLPRESEDAVTIRALNERVLHALGMQRGVSHMEFIKSRDDGQVYFLEVGARVGGANTAEMVEAATGINLWREWAKIEVTQPDGAYTLSPEREEYGGVIVTLARQEWPDTSGYAEPEIRFRLPKLHHVGFVLASPDPNRVRQLLDEYRVRFEQDFHAALPPYEERPQG